MLFKSKAVVLAVLNQAHADRQKGTELPRALFARSQNGIVSICYCWQTNSRGLFHKMFFKLLQIIEFSKIFVEIYGQNLSVFTIW